ncbi:hypothetical protein ACFLT4_06830 [Chloroflexota bacterium]
MVDDTNTNTCYLCGLRPAETKDHLFPRGLFPRPLPSNLPTGLPSCRQCNNELSKDEEQFRLFLALGMAYESDAGRRIWDERIRSALKGRRPGLKPLAQSMLKVAKVKSESGAFLGYWPISEQDPEPINRVLSKIVKGFYFLETKQTLPCDVQILFGYDAEKPERLISPPLDEAIKEAKRVDYGDGVVSCWRNRMKDDPTASITWLRFYEDKLFMVVTFLEEALPIDSRG